VLLSKAALKSWTQNNSIEESNRVGFLSYPVHMKKETQPTPKQIPTTDQVHVTVSYKIVAVYAENSMKPVGDMPSW
jgi:hypothetical protein